MEKLSRRNPQRMEKQIQALKDLDSQGRLQGTDKKLLAELEQQIVLVRQAKAKVEAQKAKASSSTANNDKVTESSASRGIRSTLERHENASGVFVLKGRERRSIYWDPVFNPTGLPPDGHPYAEWSAGEDSAVSEDEEILYYRPDLKERLATDIPLPKGPALRFERNPISTEATSSRTTYEAAPVVRDLKKESAAFVPAAVQRATTQQRKRAGSFDEPDTDLSSGRKVRHVEIEDEDDS